MPTPPPTKSELTAAKELLELLKDINELRKQEKALSSEQLNVLRSLGKTQDESLAALQEQRTVLRSIQDQREKLFATQKEELAALEQQITSLNGLNQTHRVTAEIQEARLEQARKQTQLARDEATADASKLPALKAALIAEQKLTDEIETRRDRQESLNSLQKSFLSGLGTAYSGIVAIATEAFNAQKAFERAFQMPESYTKQLSGLHDQLAITGVSMTELTEGTGHLISNVTDFTMASASQQRALQETTARLNELGVASSDVATGVQNSMKYFSQSIEGAEQTARELFSVAKELQVVPGEMAAQYAAMGPQLAKFGREGISTFKELSRIQKLTGMEMSKVIQIASKFDTFEGAAEATGKLNAALGGNFVNAMDMMMDTDPASRFDTIRSAIEDAGLSFDTMSYYQKQFYTDALGLSDVGDLALMLSGRTDLMTDSTQANAESQVEMAEKAQKVMNISDQWNAILAANSDEIIQVMHGLQGVVKALMQFAPAVEILLPLLLTYKAAMGTIAIANLFYGKTAVQASIASRGFWKNLIPMALAFTAITIAMQIFSPSRLVIALVSFGRAMSVNSKVLGKAAPALHSAGVSMMTFGGGVAATVLPLAALVVSIAILAVGMGEMGKGMAVMFEAIDLNKMLALTLFMATLALGAPLLVVAALGLLAFAAGMGALAFSLKFIATDDLTAIASIMTAMAVIDFSNFGQAASGIRGIAKALDDMPIGSLRELSGVGKELEAMAGALNQIQGDQAEKVATSMAAVTEAINDVPVAKTMVLSVGFGAMAMAAAAMAPIAMAFAAGAGVTRAVTGAQKAPAIAAAGGGGAPKEINIKLDADATKLFLKGEIINVTKEEFTVI
jgi:hypothetical protein